MNGSINVIDYKMAVDFLLPRHYSGRVPTISRAYGWFDCKTYTPDHLMAVVTFGKPASPRPCESVCGKEYAASVYELNRLCRRDEWKEPLSQFVSACLRRLRADNWIVISYSDTAMNHHGYIYQACNFLYCGASKERTDKYVPDGKHPRHYNKQDDNNEYRIVRSSKHRYVYFCTINKRLLKQWKEHLLWVPQEYPKGDNSNYVLGEYIKPQLVKCK